MLLLLGIFFFLFPVLVFNFSPCRCCAGTCELPFQSTQRRNCAFIIAPTPAHIRLVRRKSNNQKHLWSRRARLFLSPPASSWCVEGTARLWTYRIQQTLLSGLVFVCHDFRCASCSGETTFNLQPHFNLWCPVELETSKLAENSKTVSFHF